MTLGDLSCTGCGTGNGRGVGCTGGKVVCTAAHFTPGEKYSGNPQKYYWEEYAKF